MTLRELIFKIKEYLSFFWSKIIWIALISLLFAALFAILAKSDEVKYVSKLTFMINEDEESSIGGLGSVLGQFGLGGGGGGSEYNLEKVIELANSRRIIQGVLLSKTDMTDTGEDYMANHIIRTYDLHRAWEEDGALKEFLFTHDSIPAFDRRERKALLQMYGLLVGGEELSGLINLKVVEGTGIISLGVSSRSEDLSIDVPQVLYEQLSKFYIAKSTEKQRSTFEAIREKTDSIKGALRSAEYSLARVSDRSNGVSMRKDRLRETQLLQEIQLLQIMYGEAVKNLETSRFMLQSVTPFFQLIDLPMSPLPAQRTSALRKAIIGSVLGGVIALMVFGVIKLYRDTME